MQCVAILASGARCPRQAAANSQTCARHRSQAEPPRTQPFYAQRLPRQSRRALTEAAQLDGLAEEIAVLRTLIREMAAAGELDAARRAIEALSRILHAQRTSGEPSDRLAAWLEDTLDELESGTPDNLPEPAGAANRLLQQPRGERH